MLQVELAGGTMPALGFGTWPLKGAACRGATEAALAVGYRHIDTAQMYANEREVGDALRASDLRREELFIVTKVWPDNLAAERLLAATRTSHAALGGAPIDLLLIHKASTEVPLAESLGAMRQLQQEGLVRHVGVSNFGPDQLAEATRIAAAGDYQIACNQIEYHPYRSQAATLAYCRKHEIAVTAYSPLGKGRVVDDRVLAAIGERHGKSPAQVALRWLVQQQGVAAIPKAATEAHLRANFAIFDFRLTAEETTRIDALARAGR